MLLGGGSFKTLPTCLSGVEGMHSWVTSLIDIPSSQGGGLERGGRGGGGGGGGEGGEFPLLRLGKALGDEGMQLPSILHPHL